MARRQRQLSLNNFLDFARREFPGEFAQLAQVRQYTFDLKNFTNEHHKAQQAELLLVGRYYSAISSRTNAWALATSSGVSYYLGHKHTHIAKAVPTEWKPRIYFNHELLSLNISAEDGSHIGKMDGYQPKFKAWRDMVEAVINFMFLWTGRLEYVNCPVGVDMLGNFRIACLNFRRGRRAQIVAPPIPPTQASLKKKLPSVPKKTPQKKLPSFPKETPLKKLPSFLKEAPQQKSAFKKRKHHDDAVEESPSAAPLKY